MGIDWVDGAKCDMDHAHSSLIVGTQDMLVLDGSPVPDNGANTRPHHDLPHHYQFTTTATHQPPPSSATVKFELCVYLLKRNNRKIQTIINSLFWTIVKCM